MTHICINKITIIGSDNGLSPGQRQAIIWTSAGILLIGPLGTNFNESLIVIHTFSFKKIHLKMSSGKWRPFCLGLNELLTQAVHALLCFGVCQFHPYPSGLLHWHWGCHDCPSAFGAILEDMGKKKHLDPIAGRLLRNFHVKTHVS